jgi:hypothetical protein
MPQAGAVDATAVIDLGAGSSHLGAGSGYPGTEKTPIGVVVAATPWRKGRNSGESAAASTLCQMGSGQRCRSTSGCAR